MYINKRLLILCALAVVAIIPSVRAQSDTVKSKKMLTIGGYGEAVVDTYDVKVVDFADIVLFPFVAVVDGQRLPHSYRCDGGKQESK